MRRTRISPLLLCILAPTFVHAQAIWNPETPGTLFSDHDHNNDGVHRLITWREHAGFRMYVDDQDTYDNWTDVDKAPQVRIDLDNPPIDLRDRDFVIQTRLHLHDGYGQRFHTGLCVAFSPNDLLVFGPHGSTDLRLRRPHGTDVWWNHESQTVFLKLKRLGAQYAAWYSEDGQIWSHIATVTIPETPLYAGTILKTWSVPKAETVDFDYFEITHVEGEPAVYELNTRYTGVPQQGIHFIYDLSGIDILMHLYLRHANSVAPIYTERKLYFIHGSAAPGQPYDPSGKFNVIINQNLLNPVDETGGMNMILVAPTFLSGTHPYYEHRFQYRSLAAEEDWWLIDIHENFVRERFPASTPAVDDKFYLVGSSAGGQFVDRFCMAHARKLHRAVIRAAGGITLFRNDLQWPWGLDLSGWINEQNPRLELDLESLAELPVAFLVGENDNELYQPMPSPFVHSHHDALRKWIRQFELTQGSNLATAYIRPFEGHGFGYYGRRLALDYLFGSQERLDAIAQWQYSYTLDQQDVAVPLQAVDVPAELLTYSRFLKWSTPEAAALGTYTFYPDGICEIYEPDGDLIYEIWELVSDGSALTLQIGEEVFETPTLQYGLVTFSKVGGSEILEQSPFMTQHFVEDQVAGRTFHLFEQTDRDPSGPQVIESSPARLTLNADGTVVDPDTSQPPLSPTLRRWYYDEPAALLRFANETFDRTAHLQIGEWRWSVPLGENAHVAGLHTRDAHDLQRIELHTNAQYDNRLFEDWNMGPHTWSGLTVEGDFDRDGDVDQVDFAYTQACLSGVGLVQNAPGCFRADIDGDEDVDSHDLASVLACLSGPNQTPLPDCSP